MEEEEDEENLDQKKESKKRARNPSEWKREKRKRLRIAGKSYVNSRGDVVNERKIGADCKCRRKCYSRVSADQRNILFDGYYSLKSHDEQNAYLFGLIRKHDIARKRCKESDRRTCSYKYYVRLRGKDVQLCRLAFAHIHGISPHKIRILCQKQDQNVMFPRDGRGKHSNRPRKIPEDTLSRIKEHIYSIIRSDRVTDFSRDEKISGPELNISKMWKDFLEKFDPNYKEMFSGVEEIDISKQANGIVMKKDCQLMTDFAESEMIDDPPIQMNSATADLSEYPITSVADSLEHLDQPTNSQFCNKGVGDTSQIPNKRNTKHVPIVKHWLYSKVFHEEFRDNLSKKKLCHLKDDPKLPSNSPVNKSERKQKTPKKISRETFTYTNLNITETMEPNEPTEPIEPTEPNEPMPPLNSVPPLLENSTTDLQNINTGQGADMYILPVSLQDLAPGDLVIKRLDSRMNVTEPIESMKPIELSEPIVPVDPSESMPSLNSVSPLIETPAADLQNISSGQGGDMYILPVNLQDLAPLTPGPVATAQPQQAVQFNLHALSTQNNILSPLVNVPAPTQSIQCSSVVTLPAGSVSFTQNSCGYMNLNMAAFY